MNSLRESPRRPSSRRKAKLPRWLVILLVIVGVLVIVGLVYAVITLVNRPSDETPVAVATSAATCVETTALPEESLPAAKKVTVRVLNATERQGLARTVADELSDRGFTIDAVANDEVVRKQTGVAELRYGPKGRQQALLLQYYLPGAELVPVERKGRIVDIALGEAFESVAPQPEVDVALTTPVVSQVGEGCSPGPIASSLAPSAQPE